MNLTSVLTGVALGAASSATLVRLPHFVKRAVNPSQRAILLACLTTALAVAVQVNAVNTAINHLAGFNFAWPLQHVLAAVSVWLFHVFYVFSIEADRVRAARSARRYAIPMTIAIIVMVGLFVATPQARDFVHGPSGRTEMGGPGDPLAALAFIAFGVYLGSALILFTRLNTRWAKKAIGYPWLRTGLRMAAVGSIIGVLSCLHELVVQIALLTGITPAWAEASIGNVLTPVSVTLSLTGLSTSIFGARLGRWLALPLRPLQPGKERLALWWRRYTARRALYPLWKQIHHALPTIALDPPRSDLADRLRLRDAANRLYRFVIEIEDGHRAFSARVPGHVRTLAEQAGRQAGLDEDTLSAVVEAVVIKMGPTASAIAPDRVTPSNTPGLNDSGQFATQVARWLRVTRAIAKSPVVTEVVAHLATTRNDLQQ